MSANLINLLIEATGQTLYMVAISALLGTLLGLPLGLFLATSQRGELLSAPWVNKVLGLVVNATRSVPFIILVVAIIPFTRMVAGTSIGTTAAIVPLTIATVPFIARLVENAIREVDSGLIEAARACGAGPARTLFGIALPVVMPSLVAGGALAFVSAIGNFGIPALIGIPAGYTVLPTLIYQRLASFGPSIISEVAVLSVLVGCLAFAGFAVQRLVLGRRDYRTLGGTGAPLAVSLGRWRAAFEAAAWIVLALILILPLVALFATSLVSAYGVPLGPGTATLSNYAEVLLRQDATVRAFRNSTFLALTAALVLMVVAVPFAAFVVWRRSRLLSLLSGFAEIPYALPGIVLGIAAILLFLKPLPFLGISLYNTIWIILVAYLARFLTLSLRPVIAGVEQVDPALEEAARMSGASS